MLSVVGKAGPTPEPGDGQRRDGTTFDPEPYRRAIELVQIHGADYILRDHIFRGDEWIADIGCGEGLVLQNRLLSHLTTGHIIGVDISADMLRAARATIENPRVHFVRALGEALPLQENSVDVVFSNFALHWMNTPARLSAAIDGAATALRPGGVLLAYFSRQGTFGELFDAAAATGAEAKWARYFDQGAFQHPELPPQRGFDEQVTQSGLTIERLDMVDRWLPLPSREHLEFWFKTCVRPFMDRLPDAQSRDLFSKDVVSRYLSMSAEFPAIQHGDTVFVHDKAIALRASKPSA